MPPFVNFGTFGFNKDCLVWWEDTLWVDGTDGTLTLALGSKEGMFGKLEWCTHEYSGEQRAQMLAWLAQHSQPATAQPPATAPAAREGIVSSPQPISGPEEAQG